MKVVDHPSPNRAPRPPGTGIGALVLHYTGMATAEVAIERLCDPEAKVSAHYVVLEDGEVLRLVDEAEVAFHAGRSAWRGRQGLNATSIGIEIVNGGHDHGLPAYPEAQIEAVTALAHAIVERWAIPQGWIVGHSDTAPMRKADPGERFPWDRLGRIGIGVWPEPAAGPASTSPLNDLQTIGYALETAPQPTTVGAVVAAFQRRFLPERVDGQLDAATRVRLAQVAAVYAQAGAR